MDDTPPTVISRFKKGCRMFIYVMGRPHSGSTILDIALGNSASIESVGELVSGLGRETAGERCACGVAMTDCPFWEDVRDTFARARPCPMSWEELREQSCAQAHIGRLARTIIAHRRSAGLRRLGTATATLGQAIATAAGKAHALDSSKEPTRALMLLRFCPEARVIHLVRDPRHAVASHYQRFQKRHGYFKFLRRVYHAPYLLVPFMLLAAASWSVGNLICELVRRFAPGRTIRIRYEDLCDRPAIEIRRIAAAFDLPLDDLAGMLERRAELVIGHNVGGNRIRHGDKVVFDPQARGEPGLPPWLDLATLALCWPLMLHYGYRLRSTALPRPLMQEY